MTWNVKVAVLLLGLLAGGVVGYLTRPATAEIRIGNSAIQFQNDQMSGSASDALTRRIFLFAFGGGVIGLLVGFAADKRR